MPSDSGYYSRHMYNERLRYLYAEMQASRLADNKPIIDADVNDNSEALFTQIKRLAQFGLPEGCVGSSFKISAPTLSGYLENNFLITGTDGSGTGLENAARAWIGGLPVLILGDLHYQGNTVVDNEKYIRRYSTTLTDTVLTDTSLNLQTDELVGRALVPNIESSASTFTITSNTRNTITCSGGGLLGAASQGDYYRINMTTPTSGNRLDYVYMDINLQEWGGVQDDNLYHIDLTSLESWKRRKLVLSIDVAEGYENYPELSSYEDADGIRHYRYLLAAISRSANQNVISATGISDFRSPYFGAIEIQNARFRNHPQVVLPDNWNLRYLGHEILDSSGATLFRTGKQEFNQIADLIHAVDNDIYENAKLQDDKDEITICDNYWVSINFDNYTASGLEFTPPESTAVIGGRLNIIDSDTITLSASSTVIVGINLRDGSWTTWNDQRNTPSTFLPAYMVSTDVTSIDTSSIVPVGFSIANLGVANYIIVSPLGGWNIGPSYFVRGMDPFISEGGFTSVSAAIILSDMMGGLPIKLLPGEHRIGLHEIPNRLEKDIRIIGSGKSTELHVNHGTSTAIPIKSESLLIENIGLITIYDESLSIDTHIEIRDSNIKLLGENSSISQRGIARLRNIDIEITNKAKAFIDLGDGFGDQKSFFNNVNVTGDTTANYIFYQGNDKLKFIWSNGKIGSLNSIALCNVTADIDCIFSAVDIDCSGDIGFYVTPASIGSIRLTDCFIQGAADQVIFDLGNSTLKAFNTKFKGTGWTADPAADSLDAIFGQNGEIQLYGCEVREHQATKAFNPTGSFTMIGGKCFRLAGGLLKLISNEVPTGAISIVDGVYFQYCGYRLAAGCPAVLHFRNRMNISNCVFHECARYYYGIIDGYGTGAYLNMSNVVIDGTSTDNLSAARRAIHVYATTGGKVNLNGVSVICKWGTAFSARGADLNNCIISGCDLTSAYGPINIESGPDSTIFTGNMIYDLNQDPATGNIIIGNGVDPILILFNGNQVFHDGVKNGGVPNIYVNTPMIGTIISNGTNRFDPQATGGYTNVVKNAGW